MCAVEGLHVFTEAPQIHQHILQSNSTQRKKNIHPIPISQFLIPIPNLTLLYMLVVLLTNQKD